MKTIVFANQKGGVAKTTSAAALAAALTQRGRKVLCVDMDPQGNLSLGAGVDILRGGPTLYDVFKETAAPADAVTASPIGYDVIVGGLALAAADMDFTQTGREYLLRETLEPLADRYDFAVIDTPPTLGILTVNALTAADGIVIPLTADLFAVQGLTQLNLLINRVRKYSNRALKVYGLLITRYDARTTISKTMTEQIQHQAERLGTIVYERPIRNSVAIRESQVLQSDIFTEAPKANATIDYTAFVDALMGEV